jgi:hypothetical protein
LKIKTVPLIILLLLFIDLSFIPKLFPTSGTDNSNKTDLNDQTDQKKNQDIVRNPEKIFSGLKNLHLKWNTGIFKSARYYRKYMTRYILENIGREIRTDYSFRIISPEGLYGKKLVCDFFIEDWLMIKGEIDRLEVAKLVGEDTGLLIKFWRSKKLISAGGIIKNYSFETQKDEELVILHLKNIKLYERNMNDTGSDNK